jgi:ubiquitin-protein ligase
MGVNTPRSQLIFKTAISFDFAYPTNSPGYTFDCPFGNSTVTFATSPISLPFGIADIALDTT